MNATSGIKFTYFKLRSTRFDEISIVFVIFSLNFILLLFNEIAFDALETAKNELIKIIEQKIIRRGHAIVYRKMNVLFFHLTFNNFEY